MVKPVFKSTGTRVAPPDLVASYSAGETIFREGELGTEMYILSEGAVEVVTGEAGRPTVVATLGKGDFFGEMSLLDDRPRSATIRAKTDVRLLVINGATFGQMLKDNPEIAVRMMRKLARRLRDTDHLLQEALGDTGVSGPVMPEPDGACDTERGAEHLVHDSGEVFYLCADSETSIGRSDPVTAIHPHIDLTPVDTRRSISRRHAKIHRRAGKFFLVEEIGTVNGTFVGDERLETGVPQELTDGIPVRLGLVRLRFHLQAPAVGASEAPDAPAEG
jgi:hypothetical protein